ncbi:DUF177 domain-containing protein [Wenzhouxiangella sp. AB-CW3]|uniref:YceD family protein n=1 Tax=Wenzhouxiangella sp. AB-CW3 TaxID=2771012 RepID=UPI00168A707E|nr:YceD family protein [Wenzhouxiangella sp. AB-CW3]QOC23996.1 DUF177 domain-containing protein [Wenzhouxiangella sp. AB-CW3]
MSRDFPDWVQADKAAAARREFSGTVPLKRFQRLAGMIADPGEAEVAFELSFGHDEQRQVRVEVRVTGEVPLVCQRTLRTFAHALDSQSVVGIVGTDREAESLPEDYEPLLISEGRVELAALIEEELMLGLPLVPVDPASSRIGQDDEAAADTHRPFAGLAKLKKHRDQD